MVFRQTWSPHPSMVNSLAVRANVTFTSGLAPVELSMVTNWFPDLSDAVLPLFQLGD